MKKLIFSRASLFFALAILLLTNCSCIDVVAKTKRVTPNKQYQVKPINVETFNAVSILGNCDVVFTPSTSQSLELYASENVLDLIEVYVENHKLIVRIKKDYNIMRSNDIMELRVSAPMIKQAKVTGSATFLLKEDAEIDNLTLSVTGSGKILTKKAVAQQVDCYVTGSGDIKIMQLLSKSVKVKVTGSGDVKMAGSVDKAEYLVTGSGEVDAEAVKAKDVEAKITGSGDIRCYPTESLNANRTGSGIIHYKGDVIKIGTKGVHKI